MKRFGLAAPAVAASAAALWCGVPTSAAAQAACPAAGARYISDNFVARVEVVSLGGAMDPTLGCRWRRVSDGREIWLSLGPTLNPAGAAAPAPKAPAAKVAPTPTAVASRALPVGVYECDAPINVGGSMMGSPQTGPMFGVTGPGTYRDFDGGVGRYAMNGDILTMTSGPLRGQRYRRDGERLFRPMNAAGATGSIRCIFNPSKRLNGRW